MTAPTAALRPKPDASVPQLSHDQTISLRSTLLSELDGHRAHETYLDRALESLDDAGEGAMRDREMIELHAINVREAIDEIGHALVRLDEGSYGSCESCGRPIPFERLETLPEARLCLACPPPGGLLH